MPQLDTSTWLPVILSMLLALFTLFQLKISKHLYHSNPKMITKPQKQQTPWNITWTKIYLPLLQSQ